MNDKLYKQYEHQSYHSNRLRLPFRRACWSHVDNFNTLSGIYVLLYIRYYTWDTCILMFDRQPSYEKPRVENITCFVVFLSNLTQKPSCRNGLYKIKMVLGLWQIITVEQNGLYNQYSQLFELVEFGRTTTDVQQSCTKSIND